MKEKIIIHNARNNQSISDVENIRPSHKDVSGMSEEEKELHQELFDLKLASVILKRGYGTPEGDKKIARNFERRKVVQRRIAQLKLEKERGR